MKKRRFYYTSWAYFIGILVLNSVFVPLCTSTASASDSQNQDSIFVFPSMQMDSLPAKSDHVPMVEVIYRGQPPPADLLVPPLGGGQGGAAGGRGQHDGAGHSQHTQT